MGHTMNRNDPWRTCPPFQIPEYYWISQIKTTHCNNHLVKVVLVFHLHLKWWLSPTQGAPEDKVTTDKDTQENPVNQFIAIAKHEMRCCLWGTEQKVILDWPRFSPSVWLTGTPFPKTFMQVAKKILSRLFRVFVHVYIHHFDRVSQMGAEAHVNTCYKHFYYFVTEFNLTDHKELEPLVSHRGRGQILSAMQNLNEIFFFFFKLGVNRWPVLT